MEEPTEVDEFECDSIWELIAMVYGAPPWDPDDQVDLFEEVDDAETC